MPYEKTFHYCSRCHAQFDTKRRAMECESNHTPIAVIVNQVYKEKEEYPRVLHCADADGRQYKYIFQG